MKHFCTYLITCFLSVTAYAQTFYVTYEIKFPLDNKSFELNTLNCDSSHIFECPPTNNPSDLLEKIYLDMAIDKNQNFYWVSAAGSLYKRSFNDTASCQFLGTFNTQVNALVADSTDLLYAAATIYDSSMLFTYNTTSGVFDTLGTLPRIFISTGDLFFYENKLYLTVNDTASPYYSHIIEVNVADPLQSCYYMGLQNLRPYGAFSINYGSFSKAYIISTNALTSTSLLYELDMANKTIGSPICTYPFLINGAATYYNLTSNNSVCDSSITEIIENNIEHLDFAVQSPVSNSIRIISNIDDSKFSSLILFDSTGKKIKSLNKQNLTDNIDISDISQGIYILRLTLNNGVCLSTKFIKQTQ